ncbi:major facilitator superfamily (MFS) transporter [Candidatus Koribacter versatilis Ellin345]|uniref:Major facilitator superfamily (MFS) transporter n=1 Tax=Koribacter versatilis (strain Ellin345) TaxID=204669 RepID=Q1IVU0_KORVE|nr:MFS transporter [Candidatus Koribacter versatilis]ABF39010.1 major facilitator superfamily (MFS) transporter [Candidatus Koribacter versatilis Ellin345]
MRRSYAIVALLMLVYFVLSFLTNILGPIIPDIITSFHVSLTAAAILPFAFFIAYGVMSIPGGFLVERFSEKPVMVASFFAATIGALVFAVHPSYLVAIVSLFVMGGGMAVLQVALNPLLRVAGGEENFAFNSALAQLVFGLASFLSPLVFSYLVENLPKLSGHNWFVHLLAAVTPAQWPWLSMYWIFAASTALMVILLLVVRFPAVQRTSDEAAGSREMYSALMKRPMVWLYFGCIFAYVGCEQGVAVWMSKFLEQYHGFDPHTTGASAVSWFWGLMTAGCLLGLVLLKLFDSRRVLLAFSFGAVGCLTVALFGPAKAALYAFPAIGLFASIMWPTLMSLALNSVSEHHGSFAGILCTGIMGGAVVPLIIGRLGDMFGLRYGMMVLYLTFGCVLSVGLWAKPIISNATFSSNPGTPLPDAK